MTLVPVESSNIESIGFEDGVVHVKFKDRKLKNGDVKDGGTYAFVDVPLEGYQNFLESESKGTHFRQVFSPRFGPGARQ